MCKDTTMTLRNLKKDILALQIPSGLDATTVRYIRDRVIEQINDTIERKDGSKIISSRK